MKRYYLLLTLSILSFPLRAAKPICNYNEGLSSTSNDFFGETDARISLPSDREEQWWEALERGDICQIKRMLTQFSIDPNKENKDGWNPLVIAASKGYTNICQELVAHGADPNQGEGICMENSTTF